MEIKYSNKEIPFAPIFRPTQKEFKNFKSYVEKLFQNSKYKNVGCIKIIPPTLPKKNTNKINHLKSHLKVEKPIQQEITGSSFLYEMTLKTKKSLPLHEYIKKVKPCETPLKNKRTQ